MEQSFSNEIQNNIRVRIEEKTIDALPGILISIEGPSSSTEVHVTRMEADVLHRLLGEILASKAV